MHNHNEWFLKVTEDASNNAAAAKAGLVQSTLFRQLERGVLSMETITSIARAYEAGVVQSLIDTGYLRSEDTEEYGRGTSIRAATDKEIAAEVWRRMVEK